MMRHVAGRRHQMLAYVAVLAITLGCQSALALRAAPASASVSGVFSVLSYNIAGGPGRPSDDPARWAAATTTIGERIKGYDIVAVQEDSVQHADFYAADTHRYRTQGNGPAGTGDGLDVMSWLPYDLEETERVRWRSCQVESGGCPPSGGFVFIRIRLTDGVYLDVYNLRASAGPSAGDLAARADNLNQLGDYIATHSSGNAVLVVGDTNARYTRIGDTIAGFVTANGLADAWVEQIRAGSPVVPDDPAPVCDGVSSGPRCEVVDKILYRSSPAVNISATAYGNEHHAFLDAGGRMLSAHDPIGVRFAWESGPYRSTEQFGGHNGDHFNDIGVLSPQASVAAVTVRSGGVVNQVGLTMRGGATVSHGGTGGAATTRAMADGEYLVSAHLCRGGNGGDTRVFYAGFITNRGNTIGGGTATNDCVTRTAPAGWQISGLTGRSSETVDKVGFIYTMLR